MRNRSIIGLALLVGAVLSLPTLSLAAEHACEFKNPKPVFKSLSPEEEAARTAKELGAPPKLSKDESQEISKGEVVVRKLAETGEARRYEALAIIPAPPSEVMKFMKNFDGYVGVVPHLEKITYSWDRNMATIEQSLKIAWKDIWYRLNVLHFGDSVITWEFLCGDIKDTSGYYKFFPVAKGAQTLIVYHVYTDTGLPIPDFLVNLLTKSSMPDVIKAIRKAVRQQKAGGGK